MAPPRKEFRSGRYNMVATALSDVEFADLLDWIDRQPEPKPNKSAAIRQGLLTMMAADSKNPKKFDWRFLK